MEVLIHQKQPDFVIWLATFWLLECKKHNRDWNYLNEWKENIEVKGENFTKTEKAQMFISWQTYEGFQITYKSIPDVCLSF